MDFIIKFVLFIVVVVGLMVLLGLYFESKRKRKIKESFESLARKTDFKLLKAFVGCADSALFINDGRDYICLVNKRGGHIRPLSSILSIEIHHDNIVISQMVKKNGVLTRAVVGGALFGGVGAVAGAASANSDTETVEVDYYEVHLTLSDLKCPHFSIKFEHFKEAKELQATLEAYALSSLEQASL